MLLFAALASRAQFNLRPKVFINYSTCYYGLIGADKDTILPAEYDLIRIRQHGIFVQKGNHFGFLDHSGNVTIPVIYEYLTPSFGRHIIAQKNGAYGIIDVDNNTLLPFEYDTLFSSYPETILFGKAGKFGLLNEYFEEILPATYHSIEYAKYECFKGEGVSDCPHPEYFIVENNGLKGLYHIKTGLVVPCAYYFVDPEFQYGPLYQEIPTFYFSRIALSKEDLDAHKFGTVNWNGKLVVPPGNVPLDFVPKINHYGGSLHPVNQHAYRKETDGYRVYSLETGNSSTFFDSVEVVLGSLIVHNGQTWGTLNQSLDFKPLSNKFSFDYNGVYYENSFVENTTYLCRYDQEGVVRHLMPPVGGIMVTSEYEIRNKKRPEYFTQKLGVYNHITGKQLRTKYRAIWINRSTGENYYWLVKKSPEYGDKELLIEIYDSNLKQVKRLSLISYLEDSYVFENSKVIPLRIEPDSYEEDRFHIYNYKGDLLYDQYFDYVVAVRGLVDKKGQPLPYFWVLRNKDKYGLINPNGKIVLPLEYDYIEKTRSNGLILTKDGSITILSNDLTVLATDVDGIQSSKQIELKNRNRTYHSNDYVNYLLKGNTLYCLTAEHEVVRLDESNYDFGSRELAIIELSRNYYLINKKGKIVQHKSRYEIEETPLGYRMHLIRNESYLLDMDGAMIDTIEPETITPTVRYNTTSSSQKRTKKKIPAGFHPVVYRTSFYWKQENSVMDSTYGKWFIHDFKFERYSSVAFDYPFDYSQDYIFMKGDKFGVTNRKYTISLAPEYDYIYRSGFDYLMEKDGKWGIYNRETGNLLEPKYEAISTSEFNKGHIVYQGDKIGVIDKEFNFLIPFSEKDSIIKHTDLTTILGISDRFYGYKRTPYVIGSVIYNGKNQNAYRMLNNAHILESAELNSTETSALITKLCGHKDSPYKGHTLNKTFCKNKKSTNRIRIPRLYNSYFYSETLTEEHLNWVVWNEGYEFSCENYLTSRPVATYYNNYRISNDTLVPITIYDLIIPDKEEDLNKLLIDRINQTQLFGQNCTDLDFHLAQLKKNFLLEEHGIMFLVGNDGNFFRSITLLYTELESILKKPAHFDPLG